MTSCWKCATALDANGYHRQDTCPKCSADTHVCRNCTHFDRASYNECREPQADRVVEKERSNFCDYFKAGTPQASGVTSAASLKAAADALFKKK